MNTLSNLWWITGLDFFSNFGDAIFDRDANPNDREVVLIKKMILLIMEIWKWKSKYESKEKNQAEKT